MRINLAKAFVLPALLLPVTNNNLQAETNKPQEVKKAELNPKSLNLLPFPSNINPVSSAILSLKNFIDSKTYEINEVIAEPGNRFNDPEGFKANYKAYYGIDTKNEGRFYIIHRKNGRPNSLFSYIYEKEDYKKGNLFPKQVDRNFPVAFVSAKQTGLSGHFAIYDNGEGYSVRYNFSPLINVPSHTEVSSKFLIDMENEIRKMPDSLTNAFINQKNDVMTGKNVEDTYYWLYPSWKQYDESYVADQTKRPPYENNENGFRDNRKYSNTGGFYTGKRVVIPQTYYLYGSNKLYDYSTDDIKWTRRVLYHELGHMLDYLYGDAFSATESFTNAHNKDTETFTKNDKNDLVYFYNSRSETFAHVSGALLGGFTKDESQRILGKFPRCAEHIRQNVLPRFNVEISIDQIRRDIYEGYLRKDEKKEKKLIGLISIPDLPIYS